MKEEPEYRICQSCGYETDDKKHEFHECQMPNSEVNLKCDFCFSNSMSPYKSSESLIYELFAQGVNYLSKQLRDKK